jgi:hypothetical protein
MDVKRHIKRQNPHNSFMLKGNKIILEYMSYVLTVFVILKMQINSFPFL